MYFLIWKVWLREKIFGLASTDVSCLTATKAALLGALSSQLQALHQHSTVLQDNDTP